MVETCSRDLFDVHNYYTKRTIVFNFYSHIIFPRIYV